MRILLTVHQFFPEHGAGTEVLTLGVAKELQRRGHDVRVFAAQPAAAPLLDAERCDTYEVEGIKVFRFHSARTAMGGQTVVTEIEYANRLAAGYFAHVLNTFAPEVVHFFHLSRLGGLLIDVAVKAGVPAYYTPTDFWAICQPAQLMLPGGAPCAGPSAQSGNCVMHIAAMTQKPAIAHVARLVPDMISDFAVKLTAQGKLPDYTMNAEVVAVHHRKDFLVKRLNWLHGIVTPTRIMTETLTRYGVDPDLIVQSGYGIAIDDRETSLATLKDGEQLVVGFIGTLAPHKGCHVLIDAFRRLPPGKAVLRIYGSPTEFPDYYADLVRRAGDDPAITFCGTFPRNKIGDILAEVHVLVVPSLWTENAPLVVSEALAARRPVVASNWPGLSETVRDCWNGLLFQPGKVDILHERLARLIHNKTLVSALSRNCHKPKSISTYVDELLALYAKGPLRDVRKRDYHGLEDIRPVTSIRAS